MIKEMITAFLAAFLVHLVTTSNKKRQKHLADFTSIMLYIDSILKSKTAKFAIRTLAFSLIIGSAVLGATICTINVLDNKPLWQALMAPILSVGAALPMASLVYRQSLE